MLGDSRHRGGGGGGGGGVVGFWVGTSFLGEVDGAVRAVTAGFEEGC